MTKASVFRKNIELFRWKNEKAAVLLPYIDCSHLKIRKASSGELNLFDDSKNLAYHDLGGALKEAELWYANLGTLSNTVLFVCGIGLGYAYFPLKKWLDECPGRSVVFFETNPAVLNHFLSTEIAHQILQDSRVNIYFMDMRPQSTEELENLIEEIAFGVAQESIKVVGYPYFIHTCSHHFSILNDKLLKKHADVHIVIDEFLNCGTPFFRNFYKNLLNIGDSYSASGLFGKFKKVPAIVVGAGPSLNKHLEMLESIGDSCIVLAGGSAVNALAEAGVHCHFGAGVDPNPEQYARLRSSKAFNLPYFYRNRMLHEAFDLINGPRLYIPGDDGYNTADWFEKKLKIKRREIDGGHSVTNLCVELAYLLGCDPIILVGMDLCYSGSKPYAEGIENSPKQERLNQQISEFISAQDIYGQMVWTQWKWIIEAEWVSQFHQKHPKVRLYNATEGGIGFKGIPNLPLRDVLSKYLKKQFDLTGLVHQAIQETGLLNISLEAIDQSLKRLFKSIERSINILNKLIKEIAAFKKCKKKIYNHPLETPQAALLFERFRNEIAYNAFFHSFDSMISKLLMLQGRFQSHATSSRKERQDQIIDTMSKHFHFLKEAGEVNLQLMLQAIHQKLESRPNQL